MSVVILAGHEEQINDCILRAVGTQLNDGLLAYYQSHGAVSDDLNDAEYEFLVGQGVTPGDLNDMWFEFLTNRGYFGSLNDMLQMFWCGDNGAVEAPPAGWQYGLYVGWNNGFLYGYRPFWHPTNNFGAIIPNALVRGKPIYQLSANTGGTLVVQLSLGYSGDEFISGVGQIQLELEGYTTNPITLTWSIDDDRYQVVDGEVGAYLKSWYENTPDVPMGMNIVVPVMDLDGDGNPDIVLRDGRSDNSPTITEDADSINIDLNNDGNADIEIPK